MKAFRDLVTGALFMRRLNGWLTVACVILIPVSFVFKWVESNVFISILSIWALVASHWAGYQAGRVEVKQDDKESD